ncbi:hypothetical protein GJ744_008415 [Endocarpon pusillum]|uniref:Acyltransferase 3 domain-containing protein n=1 Tax=Endocarpon pusillum TaxID=364733 RepID=A0A8H7E589_9EURO|nr:hypothetical protein GJ744_008415 [Endocarpon pusillum]
MLSDSTQTLKWIDGLRGIASVSVLTTHLARALDYDLFFPRDPGENSSPRLLQWPIIRLLWQGRIGVTIFALMTGYVCALKPLRLIRARNSQAAFSTIAKSAFRRVPRFVLPATIAMIIAWALCQCGAFTVAHRIDVPWLRDASPTKSHSLSHAVHQLVWNFRSVWTTGQMDYDDHQWALLPLLKGSMMVYVTTSITVFCKYPYRLMIYALLYCYFYQDCRADTETFGAQFFFGMLLCDFAQDPAAQALLSAHPCPRTIASFLLILTGLIFASYPADHADWTRWSRAMDGVAPYIFPQDVSRPKRYTALGVECIAMGIQLSPTARTLLSFPWLLWLGKHSFGVYLLHGTLLKTLLVWMLWGPSGQPWVETKNEQGEVIPPAWLQRGGRLTLTMAIPIWVVIVYVAAYLWTTYVDSWCARMTQRLERVAFE